MFVITLAVVSAAYRTLVEFMISNSLLTSLKRIEYTDSVPGEM